MFTKIDDLPISMPLTREALLDLTLKLQAEESVPTHGSYSEFDQAYQNRIEAEAHFLLMLTKETLALAREEELKLAQNPRFLADCSKLGFMPDSFLRDPSLMGALFMTYRLLGADPENSRDLLESVALTLVNATFEHASKNNIELLADGLFGGKMEHNSSLGLGAFRPKNQALLKAAALLAIAPNLTTRNRNRLIEGVEPSGLSQISESFFEAEKIEFEIDIDLPLASALSVFPKKMTELFESHQIDSSVVSILRDGWNGSVNEFISAAKNLSAA